MGMSRSGGGEAEERVGGVGTHRGRGLISRPRLAWVSVGSGQQVRVGPARGPEMLGALRIGHRNVDVEQPGQLDPHRPSEFPGTSG
jgi:hypothetical protein